MRIALTLQEVLEACAKDMREQGYDVKGPFICRNFVFTRDADEPDSDEPNEKRIHFEVDVERIK